MAASAIKVLLAHDGGFPGGWIAGRLPAGDGIALAGVVAGLAPTPREVQETDADVLLIAAGEQREDALALVRSWTGSHPERPVVVLCTGSANGFVERAFSAGADDLVIIGPDADISPEKQQQLAFALHKARARRSSHANGNGNGDRGELICVLGPKGGNGKTLTSCNLAVALAEMHKRVVVVDLDLQFGDVALALGLAPQRTLADLAVSAGALDAEKLDYHLATHPTGLRVLMAPTRPDQAGVIGTELLSEVYALLRSTYDFVIVDTPPAFSPEVIASIDASSQVCMVGTLDALSLKNTKLGLETLELMGYDTERVRIVLNRADPNVGITQSDVLSILGRQPDVLVASHRDVTCSVNEAAPIVLSRKRSPAAKAFQTLAGTYASLEHDAESEPTKRLSLGRSGA
jgi:pilus assembly protein CpaE